jgi:light-regulated signal transduction histidine kinase (bacteriophytochrome)
MVNDAWRRFALANGAPGASNFWVGSNYIETCAATACASDEHAQKAARGIGEVLEGRRRSFVMEYPCHSADEQRWFLLSASAMSWDRGGAVVSHTPITERVKMESELRSLNQELEHRVQERTIKLNASNKELEAFAYSVSHDLQTPLRAIAGFSQALLEDYAAQFDTQGRHYLDRIIRASVSMSRLIDELLELARLTRSELHIEAVNLGALATEVCEQLRRSEPYREAEFAIAGQVPVQGDPRLLRVVLDNLLGNAWKFTSPRAPARIEFGRLDRAGGAVHFVRDNGVGFDMNFKDKLFLPFQRLHSPAEFPGNGIGLANVARVVRLHGGEVWAESTLGYGTTFYFTLGATGATLQPESGPRST